MSDFTIELAKELVISKNEFPILFDDAYMWLEYYDKSTAKRAFLKCDFVEGIDFNSGISAQVRLEGNREVSRSKETLSLTTDCFKQWAMMSGTEKGKQIRLYFLQCEKQLKDVMQQSDKPKSAIELFKYHLAIAEEHEQRLLQIEEENKKLQQAQDLLAAETDLLKDTVGAIDEELAANSAELERFRNGHGSFFSIAGWCNKMGIRKDLPWMTRQGRLAAARCRREGIEPVKINDPRYGEVNTYPDTILQTMDWD